MQQNVGLNEWVLLKERSKEKCLGGIKVSENWRKRFNKELMQLFGNIDILSFV